MSGPRVLVVKLAALGDIVMASALPVALKRRHPTTHVTWLCGARGAELVSLFPDVDEIITVDERRLLGGSRVERVRELLGTWRTLAGRRFDDVFVGHADRRYRLVTLPVRARRLRMFERAEHGRMIPVRGRWFPDEYVRLPEGERSAGPIVREWDIADARSRLDAGSPIAGATAARPLAVLVPGGARNVLRESPHRRWPVGAYRAVAERLVGAGMRVALVGDANDRWVLEHFAGLDVVDLLGTLELRDTLRVLRDAAVVLSHDTGPMHLARLVRAPLVALFGPTSPTEFMLEDERTTVLWGGRHLACRPCYDGRDFAECRDNVCMQSIPVDEAWAAIEQMIARGRTVAA